MSIQSGRNDQVTDGCALPHNIQLLASALDQAADAIVITDARHPHPNIVYVNRAFSLLTQYSAHEVIGKTPKILRGPRTGTRVFQRMRAALEEGRDFIGTTVNYRKDRSPFDVEWRVSPLRLGSGGVTHYVAVQRDITSRVQDERDRARLPRLLMAAEDEVRRKIASELHDHAGQMLASVMMRLGAIANAAADAAIRDAVTEVGKIAALTMKDLSRIARGLHPSVLEDLGLVEALRRTLEDFQQCGIAVDFMTSGVEAKRLPRHVEREVYRIVEEALSNVSSHSRAQHVSICINWTGHSFAAAVTDDGIGFDTAKPKGDHIGMLTMRERAASIGATLSITSTPGAGTSVIVRVPVPMSPSMNYGESL